jgi:hypothetical protein
MPLIFQSFRLIVVTQLERLKLFTVDTNLNQNKVLYFIPNLYKKIKEKITKKKETEKIDIKIDNVNIQRLKYLISTEFQFKFFFLFLLLSFLIFFGYSFTFYDNVWSTMYFYVYKT